MNQLKEFIAHARKKGMDHATIRMLLLSSGWKERDIAEAMTEETLDMAVPLPPDTGGARDAFFHLLTFASLYALLVSTIVLFFTYIERLFPDPALQTYPGSDTAVASSIRWYIAAIIVSYPLFIWISRILLREMQEHSEKAASGIRRWLTYLTLFVAASTLVGDFITLVFYLLNGELSVRFILKVLTVLIFAGLAFTYYFYSLRVSPQQAKKIGMNRIYGWVSAAIVVIAIVWGIKIAGSPATARDQQFDDRRVEDLRIITSEVQNIVYGNKPHDQNPGKPVPQSLQEVAANATHQKINLQDPENGQPYEYTYVNAIHYKICATFTHQQQLTYDIFWNHPAGHSCYDIDVTAQNF